MTPDLMLITESYGHLPDAAARSRGGTRARNRCGLNWQSQEFWYMF